MKARSPDGWRLTVRGIRAGQVLRLEADEAERADLAGSLSIPAVTRFVADLTAAPFRRDGVSLRGVMEAEVVQESVVTLEPVAQAIREPVALTFVPSSSPLARGTDSGEIELDPEGDDPPDTFDGDAVDLFEALREQLALALDPYPREASAAFEAERPPDAEADAKVSPFAALAKLREPR